jgi:hypothetical protein
MNNEKPVEGRRLHDQKILPHTVKPVEMFAANTLNFA